MVRQSSYIQQIFEKHNHNNIKIVQLTLFSYYIFAVQRWAVSS